MRWAAAAVGLSLGALIFFATRDVAQPVTRGAALEVQGLAPVPPRAVVLAAPERRAPPHSLRDTEPDGEVELDAQGQLVVTRGLRRRFDYSLASAGELTPPAIRAAIADSAPEPAREQVLVVFDRYASYLLAVSGLHPVDSSAPERQRLLSSLRREKLGEALTRIFFGDEEAFDAQRVHLDPEQDLNLLHQQTAQFERANMSAADRFKEREAAFGAEAAQRLAELDRSRAQWQHQLQAYRSQVVAIDEDPRLTVDARAAAKQRVLEANFPSELERRRVQALSAHERVSEVRSFEAVP